MFDANANANASLNVANIPRRSTPQRRHFPQNPIEAFVLVFIVTGLCAVNELSSVQRGAAY